MQDSDLESAVNELLRLGDLVAPLAIRVASRLGLADRLTDGPSSTVELAQRLALEPEALERLLTLLTAAGLLYQENSGARGLTEVGAVLCSAHPLSMRDAFTLAVTDLRAWAELEHCVRTGRSGFEHAYGETHRSYRARDSEEDLRMDRAHRAATRLDILTLARAYPWSSARSVVDVGGGTGTFLSELLRRFSHLQGTLFDLPRMVAHAGSTLSHAGVAERCRVVGGDFFQEVPGGADVYVLKAVVGGWNDAACVGILSCVRRAVHAASRVLIIEPVMGLGPEFTRGNVVQLHSLVLYGGRERSLDDYRALASAASFSVKALIPRSTLPIIELAPC